MLGALALAGGAAAYLRVSPLAVGLVAGVFWTVAPGRADRIVQDDLRKVQHPLVVLLLVTAGALWVPSRGGGLAARAVPAVPSGGQSGGRVGLRAASWKCAPLISRRF